MFKSFTYRQRLGTQGFRHIPGSFHTAGQLTASLGDFLTGSLTLASKDEVKSVADIATSLTAAPTGRVHDNVRGWGGLFIDGTKVQGTLRSTSCNIVNEGAAADYGKGVELVGFTSLVHVETGQVVAHRETPVSRNRCGPVVTRQPVPETAPPGLYRVERVVSARRGLTGRQISEPLAGLRITVTE